MQQHVAIVGYGIAGIAAAIRLRKLGHRITHFDRRDPPGAPGAGMLLHPSALRQLDKLGLLQAIQACAAPVRRITAQTLRGQPLLDIAYSEVSSGAEAMGIQRETLHRLLSGADEGNCQVLGGRHIVSLDADRGFLFDDSAMRSGPFDLIIVADGTHSMLRDQLPLGIRRDQPAQSLALVGLLDDPQGLAGDRLTQYFDGSRHLSIWPAGRAQSDGTNRCAFAVNIAESERSAVFEQQRWKTMLCQLHPAIHELLPNDAVTPNLHVFTYRDVELAQYGAGRAVVIGDAAHSMSPQLGVGAQLAMEDAETLAALLQQYGMATALQIYSRNRPRQVRRYQQASRWLTPLFQSQSPLLAMLRNHLLGSTRHLASMRQFAQALLG